MKSNKSSRIKIVCLNSMVALISQNLQILLSFFIRKIFINTLGVAYLGYNSVFANILQMLNLADLGIGVAITSFLYKPLTKGDTNRVSALMFLYKKIYNIIGAIILILGIIISYFLEILIPDASCGIEYLRVLFYINLMGTVSTYFLAYKRTLVIADQKSYLTNLVDMIISFIISSIQIIMLFIMPNYITYLVLGITKNIISNIILSLKATKLYGKINKTVDNNLLSEYRPQVIEYVKDIFISRIGATIYYGTDNVIISIFKGSLLTGYLSNYTMITIQLSTIVNQLLSSLQASFGSYINSDKTLIEQKNMTDNYFCVNFCIGNFCMVCFALLAQPFITLFLDESFTLKFSTVLWLAINLMLTIMIQLPSQVFTIYKLFHFDKPIIILSAILNIVISIVLVQIIEIDGVLIGTFITSLIYLFSRIYIISKYVYYVSYIKYIKKTLFYFCISTASFIITWYVTQGISGNTIITFIIRSFIVGTLSILIPTALLSFSNEFKFLLNKLLPKNIKSFCNRINIYILCIIVIIASLIMGRLK